MPSFEETACALEKGNPTTDELWCILCTGAPMLQIAALRILFRRGMTDFQFYAARELFPEFDEHVRRELIFP